MTQLDSKKSVIILAITLMTILFLYIDPFGWIADTTQLFGHSEATVLLFYLGLKILFTACLFLLLSQTLGKGIWRWQPVSWRLILLWIVLILLNLFIDNILMLYFPPPENQQAHTESIYLILRTKAIYLHLIDVILVAPLAEELIFRAGLMSLIPKKYSLDLHLSAICFSFLHLLGYSWTWPDFILYGLIGYLMAFIYKSGKSIWYPILAHALWNTIASWGIIIYLLHHKN